MLRCSWLPLSGGGSAPATATIRSQAAKLVACDSATATQLAASSGGWRARRLVSRSPAESAESGDRRGAPRLQQRPSARKPRSWLRVTRRPLPSSPRPAADGVLVAWCHDLPPRARRAEIAEVLRACNSDHPPASREAGCV